MNNKKRVACVLSFLYTNNCYFAHDNNYYVPIVKKMWAWNCSGTMCTLYCVNNALSLGNLE